MAAGAGSVARAHRARARRARRARAASRSARTGTSSWPTPGTAACSWCRPAPVSSTACASGPGTPSTLAGGSCTGRRRPRTPDRRGRRRSRATSSSPRPRRSASRRCGRPVGPVVTVAGHRHGRLQRGRARRRRQRARRADRRGGGRGRRPLHRRHRQLPGAGAAGRDRHALRAGRGGRPPLHRGRHGCVRSSGQGGPLAAAQLWNPVAVTLDARGRSPRGRQRRPVRAAGTGAGQRHLLRHGGRAQATSAWSWAARAVTGRISPTGCPPSGPTAELNDPRGLALGPTGALFVTDGFMHVIRVVPAPTRRSSAGRMRRATSTRWPAHCPSPRRRGPTTARAGCSPRWGRRSASRSRRRVRSTTATPARTRSGS